MGNVLSVTDALGRTTTFQYDTMNRKVAESDPLPNSMAVTAPTTTWTYDADGNMLSETDPLGNTTSTSYDGWNRAVSTTDALGNTTTTAYDPWNNVVAVTDPLGRTTQYVYNNQGEKIEQIAPDPDDYTATGGTNGTLVSPTTYYGFDAAGNLSYVTEPPTRWRHGFRATLHTPPGISTTAGTGKRW